MGAVFRASILEQLREMAAPNGEKRMGAVSARLIADRNENIAPAPDAFDFALQDAEFRRFTWSSAEFTA